MLKDIPEYEGLYAITNMGRVWSYPKRCKHGRKTGKWLSPVNHRNGYLQIVFSKNGERKKYLIHRLVAFTFLPCEKNGLEINHKNGIRNDNRVENLEWVTRQQNNFHAYRVLGRINSNRQREVASLCGKKLRKLKIDIANEIRDKYRMQNISMKTLGELYSLSASNIYNIIRRKSYV